MFKRNKLYTAVVTSSLLICSTLSIAQQTETTTASVEVSEAFTLAIGNSLDFGTLAVVQRLALNGGTAGTVDTAAVVTIPSNGDAPSVTTDSSTTNSAISRVSILTPGTPATFTVSNAARFTDLTVQFGTTSAADTEAFTLTNPAADTSANSTFTAGVDVADVTLTGGGNLGALDNTTNRLRTDGSGNAAFAVGATISANQLASQIFDGTYTGTFTVRVDY